MRNFLVFVLTFSCSFNLLLSGQEFKSFQRKELVQNGDTLRYRIQYPEKMKPNKHYPLVLFLHGAGERGNDNEKQLEHGAELFQNKKYNKRESAVVIFPQCPENTMWTHRTKEKTNQGTWKIEFPLYNDPTQPAAMVNLLVDDIINSGIVDPNRVYVMGLSMGGIGVLDFLCRWPEKYAAGVVICGGHNPDFINRYYNTPIWFFHGAKDDVVPLKYSLNVYDKLHDVNPKTKYTIYPDANHNSWDSAFAEPDLLKWLFRQKKN
jgi:predicted peptidase